MESLRLGCIVSPALRRPIYLSKTLVVFLESKELPEQVSELAHMHRDMTVTFYDRVEKQTILGAQPEYLDWEALPELRGLFGRYSLPG